MTKKLLLITDLFPPDPGGRSDKMARHVRHFEKNDINVTILCPATPQQRCDHKAGKSSQVERLRALFDGVYPSLKWQEDYGVTARSSIISFLIPKGYVRWVIPAYIRAVRLIKLGQVNVVMCVSNPITMQIIGMMLKLRFPRIRYIAELRDPVVGYYRSRHTGLVNKSILYLIFKIADKVVEWADFSPQTLIDKYSEAKSKYCRIDTVGYDLDDFEAIEGVRARQDYFNLVYTGGFYGELEEWDVLFKALTEYSKKNSVIIDYYGHWSEELQTLIDDSYSDLKPYIKTHGFIPKKECVDATRKADALLYVLHDSPENVNRVSSKVYDYIAANVPIISILPPGCMVKHKLDKVYPGFVVEYEVGGHEGMSRKVVDILYKIKTTGCSAALQDYEDFSCNSSQLEICEIVKS